MTNRLNQPRQSQIRLHATSVALLALTVGTLSSASVAWADTQSALQTITEIGRADQRARRKQTVAVLKKGCAAYGERVGGQFSFFFDDGVTADMSEASKKRRRNDMLHLSLIVRNAFRDTCADSVKVSRARTAAAADYVIAITVTDNGGLRIGGRTHALRSFNIRWTMTGKNGFADAREMKPVIGLKDSRQVNEAAAHSLLAAILLRAETSAPEPAATEHAPMGDAPPPLSSDPDDK